MKFKKKYKSIKILLLTATLLISACVFRYLDLNKKSNQVTPNSKSGYFLGTYINIKIYDNATDKIFDNVFSILKDVENKMSINISTSEVSRINENSGQVAVKVSPETFSVIKRGKYYSNSSKGSFDISIGPLVKLWGIGSDHAKLPSPVEINNAKSKINYNDILLDENNCTVKLKNKDMIIDLGAIAKGYAADEIVECLKSNGINAAIIDLGGNIYALGNNPKKDSWSIGIQNPIESRGEPLGILNINNKSIVTSGVYERFFEKNGKKYHHILSPSTGYPVENSLISTTIVSDKSIDGDALSTTLFTLGIENGLKFIESIENVDAILVNSNKEVYITSGLKDKFKITNNEYKIAN